MSESALPTVSASTSRTSLSCLEMPWQEQADGSRSPIAAGLFLMPSYIANSGPKQGPFFAFSPPPDEFGPCQNRTQRPTASPGRAGFKPAIARPSPARSTRTGPAQHAIAHLPSAAGCARPMSEYEPLGGGRRHRGSGTHPGGAEVDSRQGWRQERRREGGSIWGGGGAADREGDRQGGRAAAGGRWRSSCVVAIPP